MKELWCKWCDRKERCHRCHVLNKGAGERQDQILELIEEIRKKKTPFKNKLKMLKEEILKEE